MSDLIPTTELSIEERLIQLEEAFKEHNHTGLDGKKILFSNLGTVIYKEATIDPSSLVNGAGETHSVTVEGATLGDFVLVSAPYDLQDISVTAYVQSADTVEIRIQNESGSTIDLANGETWRIAVIKKKIS